MSARSHDTRRDGNVVRDAGAISDSNVADIAPGVAPLLAPEGSLPALSASDLARALRTGDVSAREVVDAHIDMIERSDGLINAICTTTFDGARADAAAADKAFTSGAELPPLHGVPIVHKDLLDTAGIRTTYGSEAFSNHIPTVDAAIVSRARSVGAITLGKTNTPQFGTGGHTANALFGTTRNPWNLLRSAGGSSGGSAAALAAGMSPLATGTDMAGSLRIPASFCNVVGLRPSPGRIPYVPSTMQWFPFITAGPMARSVTDLALLLAAVAGPDRHAAISLEQPLSGLPALLDTDTPRWRVAWAPSIAGLPVDAEVRDVLAAMPIAAEALGADIVEAEPDLTGAEEAFLTWRAWYYATEFGDLLRDRPEVLDESTKANTVEGLALTGEDLGRAEHIRSALFHRVATFFDTVDFLLMPCTPVAAFPADQWRPDSVDGQPLSSYLDWMRHLYCLTAAGMPAMSLPAGFTRSGLPVGVQIVAGPRQDRSLVQFAAAMEHAIGPLSC